jgi:hypothetical protein
MKDMKSMKEKQKKLPPMFRSHCFLLYLLDFIGMLK